MHHVSLRGGTPSAAKVRRTIFGRRESAEGFGVRPSNVPWRPTEASLAGFASLRRRIRCANV
jgi:hypothetical protein